MKPRPSIALAWPDPRSRVVDLAIVIVNFRTADLTIDCLRSLEGEVPSVGSVQVVVVDNASGDDSPDRIERAIREHSWEGWCVLVRAPRNGGFAYGNNRGIDACPNARYVLLLNSDTLVNPGCLRTGLEFMDAHPRVGCLSCKLLNADGSLQNAARAFPTPLKLMLVQTPLPWKLPALFAWANTEDPAWDRATTAREVDWVGGAFMLVRGELLARIGGLDEDFFFYGEDIEFCHRVHAAGSICYYDPSSSIVHLGGSSSDPTRLAALARSLHHWRGRYLVQRKCWGRAAEWSLRAFDLASNGVRALWHRVFSGAASPKFQLYHAAYSTIRKPLWGKP